LALLSYQTANNVLLMYHKQHFCSPSQNHTAAC